MFLNDGTAGATRTGWPTANWLGGLAFAAGMALFAGEASADQDSERWVRAFWPQARAAGITPQTYNTALGHFEPDPDILSRAENQAEFVKPIWEYLDKTVSEKRIADGRQMLARYAGSLANIEQHYGVDRHILVAIWGMESSYGAALANTNWMRSTVRSLATLAYAGGKRANFGRQQLIAALKIIQRGDVSVAGMTGSWAGAMGHTQFIPTTFEAYGVDFDGDGRRNIWTSPIDALASAANYLNKSGWDPGKTWGYEVALPNGFDFVHADPTKVRPLSAWATMGFRPMSGGAFPRPTDEATLLLPAGAKGPAFLMLKNFRVIKRYNNADAYALAVGHLADRLKGYGAFAAAWPVGDRPLAKDERADLQALLSRLGYYDGEVDGELGPGSRAAIRAYQSAIGVPADGFATAALLQRLKGS